MGTEVQLKMYLPGYFSSRDLNDSTGGGNWSLCQQNGIFGPYHDFLSTRPAIDVSEEHEKLQLRQTILKHESMFRHQLHELHRLYKIQRDMMNEMRSGELQKHLTPARSSQSILYSSGLPSPDDQGRQHISTLSTLDLNHGRLTMVAADSIQCQFGSMKENTMQSSYGPAQNRLRLKDYETLESKCKKLQRRLFDLELPAEEYISEEKEDQGGRGVQAGESYLLGRNHEVTHGVNSGCNSDAPRSHLYMRKPHAVFNLDEPIKFKEASASASNHIFGNIISSKEEMERRIQSPNLQSGFRYSSNKFSQDPRKGKDGVVSLSNLHLETERQEKGWSAYNGEAGQTRSNGGSLCASFRPEDFTTSKQQQLGLRNSNELAAYPLSDQNKTQSHVKKKLFGVEIGERNHGASLEASSMLFQHPIDTKSDVTNSESSSISSWKKLYSGLNENMVTVQGNCSFGTFTQSNKSSVTLMHCPEVIGDKLLVNNLRSVPSIRAEASYQNEHSIGSQLESKESWVCFSSNGFGHLNGISDSSSACGQFASNGPKNNFIDLGNSIMNTKSADEKKMNAAPPNSYQNEAISKAATDSLNGMGKSNPHGGLTWLKIVPPCNGNSYEERQGSSQMNLDSLPNCSQTFTDKPEMTGKSFLQRFVQDSSSATCALDSEHWKSEVGECSSNRKVLGFSIFEKLRTAKDLPTPNPPSKPSFLVPAAEGTKACDPSLPEFKKQHKVEGLAEKGLVDHCAEKRHHIDLNLCVVEEGDEEEGQPTLSSSGTKIAIELDLEAPVDVEPEIDIAPGFESYVRERQESVKLLQDESRELHEGLIQEAAEALFTISSCHVPPQTVASCNQSEDSPNDPLRWFAEVISTYKGDFESEVGSFSSGQGSANVEHTYSEGMDYFEIMTLNLEETKIGECIYKPEVLENATNESIMTKRPRRGQARRGRQRKDFQKDILPTIALLLKNEVTEDIQTIEGLIRATGGTWQSSLSLKNTSRNGVGKRKRRGVGSDSPPNVTAVCPPQAQPPKCRELAFEETSLLGWGKRTRRPPRQRCPISSPPLSIK